MDKKKLDEGFELFKWSQKLSKTVGLWPLASNYYLFVTMMLYFSFYMTLALTDLYKSVYDFEKLVDNCTENLGTLFIFARLLTLCVYNNSLGEIISQVFKDFNVNTFESLDEIEIFMESINIGKLLLKGFLTFLLSTEVIWYFSALISPTVLINDNNQTTYTIPYNIYLFYEVNTLERYYLTYLFLLPTLWIFGVGNIAVDSILISLLFYISGKMAALTMRIDALENFENGPNRREKLNEIIAEHCKLLKMGDGVKDAFSSGLLVYLININFIICMLGYQMLISYMTGRNVELISYSLYLMEMYFMLSIFCLISEYLTTKSLKCCEAFYNIGWYNLPIDCGKDIIFCIKRSQQPLALWAGQFTTFSSVTLTDVTKAAMSYLSVLRTFMITD